MKGWLADFPYRVALSWEIFALAGLLAVAASVLIVSLHTFKAARADPVGSIRNE
jgi:putative ABC transport system permease protein